MLDIAFARSALPKSGTLVLLVDEGQDPKFQLHAGIDAATGGQIERALAAAEFTGKKGQSATVLAPGAGLSRVVAFGLGKRDGLSGRVAEEVGGAIAVALARETLVGVDVTGLPSRFAAALAMGAVLRSYRFDKYRTAEKPEDKPRLTKLTLIGTDKEGKELWEKLRPVVDGIFLSRDLVSEPPNVLFPASFADRCKELTKLGLAVEVMGPRELTKLGFGALLAVAQGSVMEPRVVVMHWRGAPAGKKKARPLAFVGKGVTFDSGGISIKPAGGMEDMKWDMAGAGTVVGLMAALAGRKARADVIGIVGLVENMPSGSAQRPGDVVKTYSGQTVEIINTDAEGRMVLADLLWYTQAKYDPEFMVDLATLTGAMVVSLGHEYAGFFSNDDVLSGQLHAAGQASGEKAWRLPLDEAYDKLLKSEIADMKHVGPRPGGAISAAQFLQRFVNGRRWAHLDIAGMAWSAKDAPTIPKGATAYGVRLLNDMVAAHHES